MSEIKTSSTQATKKRVKHRNGAGNRPLPPGPQGYLLLKLSALQHRPIEYLSSLWWEYGDLVRLPIMPGFTMFFAVHPEAAEHILSQHPDRYVKPDFFLKPMGLVQGKGLFSSEGEYWRKQRRLMQPAFQQKQLVNLQAVMLHCVEELLRDWESKPDGEVFDIAPAMTQLTLKILGLTLFSIDISEESNRLGQALRTALEYVYYRLNNPLALATWILTPRNLKFHQAKQTLDEIVLEIVRSRRQNPIDRPDLLSILLTCRDEETGEGMSDRELQDEIITLINAGHETTATTLTWTWYLLGSHPDIMAKMQDEIQTVLHGSPPTLESLPQLQYTRQVFDESIRFCPAGLAMAPRVALEDDEIQGYFIPKGATFIIGAYFTWRHPEFWDNPEQFNPDRFLPECADRRPKFAYLPFGAGPHTCIGKNYALIESITILAAIVQRFHIELLRNQTIEIDPRFTLRPKYGIQVTARKRH
ncbi:MAG: cytochrome P450 [Oscillatoriaceae cyanobacterium Prado104]|jgi:cytochrome P450|nr:cytochrome P450 [Oscillatoriaceae cyanobacterium Prado104]